MFFDDIIDLHMHIACSSFLISTFKRCRADIEQLVSTFLARPHVGRMQTNSL